MFAQKKTTSGMNYKLTALNDGQNTFIFFGKRNNSFVNTYSIVNNNIQ